MNPATDRAFVAFAERMLGESGSAGTLQAALRVRYPDAVVRARELSGELVEIWYVYRDGHWTRSRQGDPGDTR
ncbi:MAG: hypothetical protein HYX57_03080 [Chloroflexi bacterium]|nr:hypothetical protein [Chloroflexota bacterium]